MHSRRLESQLPPSIEDFYHKDSSETQRPKKLLNQIWVKKGILLTQAVLPQNVKKECNDKSKTKHETKKEISIFCNPEKISRTMLSLTVDSHGNQVVDEDLGILQERLRKRTVKNLLNCYIWICFGPAVQWRVNRKKYWLGVRLMIAANSLGVFSWPTRIKHLKLHD
ncbi:hypothetical protein Tco_0078993 [Tanacetum coccineum]